MDQLGPAEMFVHVLVSSPDVRQRLELLRLHHYFAEDLPRKVGPRGLGPGCVRPDSGRPQLPYTFPPCPTPYPSSQPTLAQTTRQRQQDPRGGSSCACTRQGIQAPGAAAAARSGMPCLGPAPPCCMLHPHLTTLPIPT
ncbi:hypothetical protein V8C86DRAFT_1685200 [Haematococcus lacustris]